MKKKIIISCRDQKCLEGLREILAELNLEITAVESHADLLLEVLNRDYDTAIYGFDNAKGIGLKIVKILKKIRPKVPLIVISDDPSSALGGKVLQEGVAYYALKPLNPEAMRNAVRNALDIQKTHLGTAKIT